MENDEKRQSDGSSWIKAPGACNTTMLNSSFVNVAILILTLYSLLYFSRVYFSYHVVN